MNSTLVEFPFRFHFILLLIVSIFMECDNRQPHNKSNLKSLRILELDGEEIKKINAILGEARKHSIKKLGKSACTKLSNVKDGRLTDKSKKVAFAYHVVALQKFGPKELSKVSSAKTESNALTISHVCGTEHCINKDHIILETKHTNDERVHCHFVMEQAQKLDKLEKFNEDGFCQHVPKCGSL